MRIRLTLGSPADAFVRPLRVLTGTAWIPAEGMSPGESERWFRASPRVARFLSVWST